MGQFFAPSSVWGQRWSNIISPTFYIDEFWEPVKPYMPHVLNMNPEKEHRCTDHCYQQRLDAIVETQEKVADYMKEQNI